MTINTGVSVRRFCAALASVAILSMGGTALARTYNGKTVTSVHTGQTATAHSGRQCFFKMSGVSGWFYVPQSPAGQTNCSIVTSAFLSGKKLSVDVTASGSKEVKYMCMAAGNC